MMMNRVVFHFWVGIILSLLVVWKSGATSHATAALGSGNNKLQKLEEDELPNLAEYERHFPPVILDLTVFLEVQRRKQQHKKAGVARQKKQQSKEGVISGGESRIVKKRKRSEVNGLYVLDLLNKLNTSVKVLSHTADEIDVLLEPDEAWTRELVTLKTRAVDFLISVPYRVHGKKRDRRLLIYKEPFCSVANPANPNPMIRQVVNALSCRSFRLSKWVFSPEVGVLAMIYVQVHRRNENMVARLFLVHLPNKEFGHHRNIPVPQRAYMFWIYQNSMDSKPMPLNQVNVTELVSNMQSLASAIDDNASNQTISSENNFNTFHEPSSAEEAHSYRQPSAEGINMQWQSPHQMEEEEEEEKEIIAAATILHRMSKGLYK